MSLWSQIKQRRITQVVFAYLAGGWMVLAVIDQVVDREVLPLVVYETALALYLVGIAAALIIGWYHGELGEQRAPMREIVLLSIVGVIGLGTAGMVIRSSMQEAAIANAMPENLRRIAVLYLQDMSRDGSMQVVGDGITEALIEDLSSVRALDVSSRNAAREARSLGDVSVDSIARTLGVATVIDGTIDRTGDEVRVLVRLVEGQTGTPLFRRNFAWPAEQLASAGSEVAREVAEALRERLGGEIRVREGRAAAPNNAAWLHVARAESFLKDHANAIRARNVDGIVTALDAAEAELAAAVEVAPEWAVPHVLRAQVAYEWYILSDGQELIETLDQAVAHANAALAIDPSNAAALEWRGTARYRRYLAGMDDRAMLEDLLTQAQADLERSETLDPDRASANSTLSHLYNQIDDRTGTILAARTAYEQDAFLDVADGVLWRLYTALYDQNEYREAQRWCNEGRRRFPQDFRFVQCQLFLMTMTDAQPDPAEAWQLYDQLGPLLTEQPEFFDAQARTIVAGILGRAGLPDSANAVFESARLGADADPTRELLVIEAAMRSVIGDESGSIAALERFMVTNPGRAPGEHWWWRNVQANPGFVRLRAER